MNAPSALTRPPLFNHVFVVVDAETISAVNACSYLADESFGRFATVESESTLIGRYRPTRIFGENTLIELFPGRFGAGEFDTVAAGVVLSFDHAGEREAARRRLSDAGAPYEAELIRRPVRGGGLAPWYHSTRPHMGEGAPVALFLSEMAPELMARMGVAPGPDGAQDRAGYLTASLGRPHGGSQACLDVAGVTLRLGAHADRMARLLKLMGYSAEMSGGTLRGPDAEIAFADDYGPLGVTEVRFSLRAPDPTPGRTLRLGSSTLTLSPGGAASAVWRFTPLRPSELTVP
ncbi:MAG TPA: DUF5829 family protein [Caulobacteraceae bacterium]|nr:DUF5829 family protein [Caulobacteraceae bacterium]